MNKANVAFLGLGVMGYPMAGHLSKAGYPTRVYNRTTAKAEQWCRDYEGSFAFKQPDGHNTFSELYHMFEALSPGAISPWR